MRWSHMALTGSSATSSITRPAARALVMEFLTVAPRAVPTVIGYRQIVASAPMVVHTERAMSSAHTAVVVDSVTTLPRSSVITAGVADTPARCAVVIWSSGKARPMRSASTTGSPARAAHAKGTTPLSPPSSRQQMAATCVPVSFSTASWRRSASVPDPNFSTMTVVAPIMQMGRISWSSSSSSRSSSCTGPEWAMACDAM